MKIQNKSIVAITAATALFASSAYADDVATVINIEQSAVPVSSFNSNVVDPKVTIQDYVDAANQEKIVNESSIADLRSRWEVERAL